MERDPDLYEALELAIPAVKVTTQLESSGTTRKRQTQVSEQVYRKQIGRISKQGYRGDYYDFCFHIYQIEATKIFFLKQTGLARIRWQAGGLFFHPFW